MNHTLVALAAAGLTLVGSAAVAAPQTITRDLTVRYADLDLESAAGIETLYTRLGVAARGVCGSAERGDFAALADMKACRARAVERAVATIDNPALTARHAGQRETRYASVADGKRG
jgi:UrcA family protein